MMTTAALASSSAIIGVPVGAILVDPQDLQPLRIHLEKQFGRFKFRGVEKRQDGRLLVHLPPHIICALLNGEKVTTIPHGTHLLPGVRKPLNLPTHSHHTHDDFEFTFVELFAGIGGFRLGLEAIGGKCVLAVESCSKATNIYKSYFTNNSSDILVEGDVLDVDLRDFSYTLLTAGFPCQSFSNRGPQRGLHDDDSFKGQLYLELVRILTDTQPPCFLFENVSQLVLMDGGSRSKRTRGKVGSFTSGRVLQHMLNAFANCGYNVDWKVVNSRHYCPQNRERVYIIGTRRDLHCPPLNWDKVVLPTHSCTLTARDILEPTDTTAVQEATLSESQWNKVLSSRRDKDDILMDLDKKAPTLISQYHRVGSLSSKFVSTANGRGRFLTPRECSRIMGFPEDYPCDDDHFYVGIGNAVTPPVIQAIGLELLKCLASTTS